MSGQPSAAARFLREAVAAIADRVIADNNAKPINEEQKWLVASKVKKFIKQSCGMQETMQVLWGTEIKPYEFTDGDMFDEDREWLNMWFEENIEGHSMGAGAIALMNKSDSFKQYCRRLAYIVLCSEVIMLLAHRNQLVSDELESWKSIYDGYHEFTEVG